MQIVGDRNVRIIPDIQVRQGGDGSMVDALPGVMLQQQIDEKIIKPRRNGNGTGNLPGDRPTTLPPGNTTTK